MKTNKSPFHGAGTHLNFSGHDLGPDCPEKCEESSSKTSSKSGLSSSKVEGWEKEFDDDFYIPCESTCFSSTNLLGKCTCDSPKTKEEIKDFIRQERKEVVGEIYQWAKVHNNDSDLVSTFDLMKFLKKKYGI